MTDKLVQLKDTDGNNVFPLLHTNTLIGEEIGTATNPVPIPMSNGGTGANNAADARDNLLAGSGVVEQTLLWENASPTSDFVSQTIDLNIDGDFILVKLLGYKGPNGNYYYTETRLLPVGDTLSVVDMLLNTTIATSVLIVGHRNIVVNTEGVTFGSGKLKSYAGAVTEDNGYIIPLEIYSAKIS